MQLRPSMMVRGIPVWQPVRWTIFSCTPYVAAPPCEPAHENNCCNVPDQRETITRLLTDETNRESTLLQTSLHMALQHSQSHNLHPSFIETSQRRAECGLCCTILLFLTFYRHRTYRAKTFIQQILLFRIDHFLKNSQPRIQFRKLTADFFQAPG